MACLLDANVFIAANNLHYGLDFCPAFWDWLVAGHESERVFSVEKVGDEVQAVGDELSEWAEERGNGFFLPPDASVFPALAEVSAWANGQAYEPAAVNTFLQVADYYLVEVVGAFAAAKSVIPAMRERGSGSVLFSSATAAFRGSGIAPLYAIGKFGLRALAQCLAKAYAKDGVHVVHFRLDCDLDVPLMRELYGDKYNPEALADPDAVAETYWWAHRQPKSAWSNEIELRPHCEVWTW